MLRGVWLIGNIEFAPWFSLKWWKYEPVKWLDIILSWSWQRYTEILPILLCPLSLLNWKSQHERRRSLSVPLSLSHTDEAQQHTHTHTSSGAFPCSGPGLVSHFLSWLQAVSFFRSCIYPLGTHTSSEQLKNSISTTPKICFHCTGKT